jgi:hypothetical protein
MGLFKRIKSLWELSAFIDVNRISEAKGSGLRLMVALPDTGNKINEVLADFPIIKQRLDALSGLPTAAEFQSVRSLAEQANILCEGMMPDSGITARKVGNLTVTTGIPNQG